MFIFGFSDYPPGRALPSDPVPDFDASAAVAINRARIMNAHVACLHTAIVRLQNYSHEVMVLNPSDVISANSFEEGYGGSGDPRVMELSLARFRSTYRENLPPIFDWRLRSRSLIVELDTVAESFRLLDVIIDHASTDALLLCDLFIRSCKAYEEHNYNLCLITAWAVTENLLQKLWVRYIEENRQREIDGEEVSFVSGARKKTLEDGRNFSASVISEVLSLNAHLPFHIYKDLTKTRKARNNWIHGLRSVSRESAYTSVEVVVQMLDLVEDIALEVALASRLHG